METCITKIKFNTTMVELEINKDYEKKVQDEFTSYNRFNKIYKFKSFIDYFMKDKRKDENLNLKVLRMVPMS